MTPWFAMGMGLVASAMLSLTVSGATLTFPKSTSRTCETATCGPAMAGGANPSGRHAVKLPMPHPLRSSPAEVAPLAGASRSAPRPQAQVRLTYEVLATRSGRGSDHREFIAAIVITASTALQPWNLRFHLSGVAIKWVFGGQWHLTDGGTIVVHGTPTTWARSDADRAKLLIKGIGKPGKPWGCLFDGEKCEFQILKRAKHRGAFPWVQFGVTLPAR